MKDFLFNNCDICLNPNIIERYVGDNKNYSNSHFVIKTACSNGKWTWGYGIMIHDQGGSCGAGRGSFEKKYGTEKEAINAACKFIREYRKRLGITVFQPRLKVCTFARTNYYEYGKQRQVQESP